MEENQNDKKRGEKYFYEISSFYWISNTLQQATFFFQNEIREEFDILTLCPHYELHESKHVCACSIIYIAEIKNINFRVLQARRKNAAGE